MKSGIVPHQGHIKECSSVVEHTADNRAVTSSSLVIPIPFGETIRKRGREAYYRILLRFRVK